jgi:hypothetical protein
MLHQAINGFCNKFMMTVILQVKRPQVNRCHVEHQRSLKAYSILMFTFLPIKNITHGHKLNNTLISIRSKYVVFN